MYKRKNILLPREWDNQPYLWIKEGSEQHKEARKQCKLTCGDYASAVNCYDAYLSRKKLYKMKKGLATDDKNSFAQGLLDHGVQMEPIALDVLMESEKVMVYLRPTFFLDPKVGISLGGSPDGVVVCTMGSIWLLEIKCPVEKVPTEVQEVKMRYIIQVMGYLHASGLHNALLMFYNPAFEPVYFKITFDQEIWDKIMEGVEQFIKCLDSNTPPPSPAKKTFREENRLEIISRFVQMVSLNDL
jgi:hypothetical protein